MAKAPQAQDFIKGWPSKELLETEQLRSDLLTSFKKGLEETGTSLNYGDKENGAYMMGHPKFRQALANWLSKQYGQPVEAKHLFTTAGGSMGLDCCVRQHCKAGDIAVVEEPTYFLSFAMMRDRGMSLLGVPMQPDGMDLDKLEEHCKQQEGKVKLVYTIPVHHNPTGITMSDAKRVRLLELARKYKFLIASDEAYQLLNFEPSTVKPLFYYDDAADPRVFSIGTFSKLIGPGVKIGWIQAYEPLLKPIANVAFIDSGNNPVIFSSVNLIDFLESGGMDKHLALVSKSCGDRCALLCKKLREVGLDVELQPTGGYFVWVKSKGKTTGRTGEPMSINRDKFHDYMRLCFAWLSPDQIEEGIEFLRA